MIITVHAARRYVQRLALNLTVQQARSDLEKASETATLIPERTDKGEQQWQTTGCRGAVLVVKHDPAAGLVAVTVLGPNHLANANAVEHSVLAAFERADKAREVVAAQPKPETWREKCDRLNAEAEVANKRREERAVRREEHKRLEAAAAARKAKRRAEWRERTMTNEAAKMARRAVKTVPA